MVDDEVKTVDLVMQAQQAADRLEKLNKEQAENIRKLELLQSRQILGGQAVAGNTEPEKKVETPAEYAKRMLRGGV